MGIIGAVTGEFLDAVADLGENLISVFTNPKKSIQDFASTIKEFVLDRINLAIEGFGLSFRTFEHGYRNLLSGNFFIK